MLGLVRVAGYRGSVPATIAFLSAGNHHDVALVEAPQASHDGPRNLAHVAFQVGASLDDLCRAQHAVEGAGIEVTKGYDHGVTPAIFVTDPDGTTVEL